MLFRSMRREMDSKFILEGIDLDAAMGTPPQRGSYGIPDNAVVLATAGAELEKWVTKHPERQDVRMAVGVLREGTRQAAIRLRSKDADTEVLSGPDLVPNLAEALLATFEE